VATRDYTIVQRTDPSAVERLLRGLPDWFGIEHAVRLVKPLR